MSRNPWGDEFYSPKEIGKLSEIVGEFRRTGDPSAAARLELKMANKVPFDDLVVKGNVQKATAEIRPETSIDIALLEIPARAGRGSSQGAWAEFADTVSETPYEILESLTRDEIINLLVDRDIINEG
jgi:hypothetical protein